MTSPFSLENRTVLVCDENGVILLMLPHAMRHLGMNVVGSVTTGEAAVEVARKTHHEFVVMEYVLLGMNGIEAAHCILAEHAACILLTTTITNPKIQGRRAVRGFMA